MRRKALSAESKIWRVSRFRNLELLRARNLTQSFPRHTHERYAIGVIERGALRFYYRGENVIASPGNINLCMSGEVHTGQPPQTKAGLIACSILTLQCSRMLPERLQMVGGLGMKLPFFDSRISTKLQLMMVRIIRLSSIRLCAESAAQK